MAYTRRVDLDAVTDLIVADYEAGMPLRAVAAKYSTSVGTIRERLIPRTRIRTKTEVRNRRVES